MRKLKTRDIFPFCRVIKALNMKDEFKRIAKEADTVAEAMEMVADAWGTGFEFLWALFEAAAEKKAENALYEFITQPMEMSREELEDLDLTELWTKLQELAELNNMTGFFKLAAESMR